MPIWDIFGSKKKKLQLKRNKVRNLARQRRIYLSDSQLDLLDVDLLDAIIALNYFSDLYVETVGAELPVTETAAEELATFEQEVASGYNEVAAEAAQEEAAAIAAKTESVTLEVEEPVETRSIPEPEPVRYTPPEPSYTPEPEPARSSSYSSGYSDSGSSSYDSGSSSSDSGSSSYD